MRSLIVERPVYSTQSITRRVKQRPLFAAVFFLLGPTYFLLSIWYLNHCVAGVCRKSARHWLTAVTRQLHTDNRRVWRPHPVVHDGVGHDSCCVSDDRTVRYAGFYGDHGTESSCRGLSVRLARPVRRGRWRRPGLHEVTTELPS